MTSKLALDPVTLVLDVESLEFFEFAYKNLKEPLVREDVYGVQFVQLLG